MKTMKKTQATMAIVLFLAAGTAAASTERSLRLSGGGTWTRYSDKPIFPDWTVGIVDVRARFGPSAAIGCELTFGPKMSLAWVSSLEYIQNGSLEDWLFFEPIFFPLNFTASYKLETLSLIQLLKGRLGPAPLPYVLAGIEVSYVLNHSAFVLPYPSRDDLTGDTRRFGLGLVGGMGIELTTGNWTPFFEFRFHQGLTNLSKGTGWFEDLPDFRTRAFTFLAGVRMKLGRKSS